MTRILRSCLVFKQRDPVRWKPLRFVSIAVLLYAASNVCALSQSLVIRHVTVIDAAGHAPQGDMTVVVERDRIISVEPSNKVHLPKESVTVDGYGKFLIPGLWDMHVHGASDERAPWSHLLFIANGVVGVRDMSGPPDARAWRAAQSSHTDPSPTIYLGSPIVDGRIRFGPTRLLPKTRNRGGQLWTSSMSGAPISLRSTAACPAMFTSRSPTKRTDATFHSRDTYLNR